MNKEKEEDPSQEPSLSVYVPFFFLLSKYSRIRKLFMHEDIKLIGERMKWKVQRSEKCALKLRESVLEKANQTVW